MRLDIYNVSPLNYLHMSKLQPTLIDFVPRKKYSTKPVELNEYKKITRWKGKHKGDGYRHIIDLGNPIITIDNEDIYDETTLKNKKNLLRSIIQIEQLNLLYYKLKVPHFVWAKFIKTNVSFDPYWFHADFPNKGLLDNLYNEIAPILISLANNSSIHLSKKLDTQYREIFNNVDKSKIPQEIKDRFPAIYK